MGTNINIFHNLNGICFVWHDKKAKSNQEKHDGISFEQACTVFFDPFFVTVDASQNYESRQAIIGYDAQGKMLYVVHIEVDDDRIRIISARKATTFEKLTYNQ